MKCIMPREGLNGLEKRDGLGTMTMIVN